MRTRFALVVGLLVCYVGVASAQVREEWVARYDGGVNDNDSAQDIALDKRGNIYVTGVICTHVWPGLGCIDYDWATLKYGADGNKLWSASYNGRRVLADGTIEPASFQSASAIAVDSAENVYVTGSICVSESWDEISGFCIESVYTTIKYDTNDTTGNPLWVARYSGPVNDYAGASAMVLDADGNVYVTGSSLGVGTSYDYATIKYDTNGNQLWVARYSGPVNSSGASAIVLDGVGNVYVTGSSEGVGTSYDYATIKYDTNGNQLWVARYNGPGDDLDWAEAIVLDEASQNVYVTGRSVGVGTGIDYATIKYDTDGNELWVARYNGPGDGADWAEAIVLDEASQNVYVTGSSMGVGASTDYATIKYDTDGNELWVARYNGPGNGGDWAAAIVFDASQNVYVTGTSTGVGTSTDYATIRYDNDGNELWVARYSNPGSWDQASAIALDPANNVYVTGGSWVVGTGDYPTADYATVKYSQTPDLPPGPPTPTVTFGTAPTPTYLGGNFTVSATTTNTDSSALSYSAVSGPCAVVDASAGTFSSSGAGICRVEVRGAATANFLAASAQQDVAIAKAVATVTLSNLIRAYTGSPLLPTATTTPPGLTIDWTSARQTNAGSYAMTATVNDPNYQGAVSGTFIIQKAAATVTLSDLTQTYTGSPLTPTATTVPPGLAIVWTNAPPTSAGSYAVTATVNDPNYQGAASGTFAIEKAAATVTLSNLTQTYTGSPLTPTATTVPPGPIVWTNAPQTNAGSYAVTATVNNPNYQGTASGNFIIQKAAATVTLSNLTQTYTGSPLTPTATTVPPGLAVVWTNAPQTDAGSYTVTATVSHPNYQAAASGSFVINPLAPTNLNAVSAKGKVKLSWTQSTSPGVTQNKIYRSTTNGGPYAVIASIGANTSYTDTQVTGGTTYYYVVTAVSGNGKSAPSNQDSAKPK